MSSGNGSKKVKVPYKFNTIQLNSLKAHPKQATVREITDEVLQGLGNFIDKVGLVEEIAINERTGHIISGHQRCKVLIDKGYTSAKVKVFDVDEDTEDLMFTNLNSQAISGAFTDDAKEWVQSLEARLGSELYQDVGLQMLEVSLADPEVAKDGLTDPDDVPATPKEAKTKTGDLYQLGGHRLLCGDATKKEDVERLMGGEKVDALILDPPYGLGDSKNFNEDHPDYADDVSFDLSVVRLDAPYVIWGGNYYDWLPEPRNKIGWLVWDKRPNLDGDKRERADRRFGQHFEIAVTNIGGLRGKMYRQRWGGYYGTEKILHKTQKPIELMSWCLSLTTGIVGDWFLGSGTTMIACEQLDRKCYGMEIDQLYCDVIVKRWESFTGKKAVLLEGA